MEIKKQDNKISQVISFSKISLYLDGGQNNPRYYIFAYKIKAVYTKQFKILENLKV